MTQILETTFGTYFVEDSSSNYLCRIKHIDKLGHKMTVSNGCTQLFALTEALAYIWELAEDEK